MAGGGGGGCNAAWCCFVGGWAGDLGGVISDVTMGEPGSSHIADGWVLVWGMLDSRSMVRGTAHIVYNVAVGLDV